MNNNLYPFMLAALQYGDSVVAYCEKLMDHPNTEPLELAFCETVLEPILKPGDTVLGGKNVSFKGSEFIGVQEFCVRFAEGYLFKMINILWGYQMVFISTQTGNSEPEIVECVNGNAWREDFIKLYNMFYE